MTTRVKWTPLTIEGTDRNEHDVVDLDDGSFDVNTIQCIAATFQYRNQSLEVNDDEIMISCSTS